MRHYSKRTKTAHNVSSSLLHFLLFSKLRHQCALLFYSKRECISVYRFQEDADGGLARRRVAPIAVALCVVRQRCAQAEPQPRRVFGAAGSHGVVHGNEPGATGDPVKPAREPTPRFQSLGFAASVARERLLGDGDRAHHLRV